MLQFTFKFVCKFTCMFTFTFMSKLLIALCYKAEIWYDIYPDQDFRLLGRGQGSEWLAGHIEHTENVQI